MTARLPGAPAPAAPANDASAREALRALTKTGEALVWNAGFIALPWLKLKNKAVADPAVETYAIGADGTVKVNPKWWVAQRPEERQFELAASLMTFLLRHHDRGVDLGVVDAATGNAPEGREREHGVWNRARAMVVNKPLRDDAIGRPPADAIFPPDAYKGPLDAAGLYHWLLKNEPPQPPQGGGKPPPQGGQGQQPPSPHAGGKVDPPPQGGSEKKDESDGEGGQGNAPQTGQQPQDGEGGLSPDDIDQMRRQVEAMARMAGQGTHCVDALKPKRVRANYRSVIPAGLDVANTEASERTKTTYARASRREAFDPTMMLPGKEGSDPSLVVVIDFSGSTGMYAQKFVDHAQKVATDFPNTKILLIAHTDRVTYQSWLKPGGEPAKLEQASRFSGGTAFAPAYDAAREAAKGLPGGKFDSLVHFTDGFNFGEWPMPPARRLVVGLCGEAEGHTPLPCPAKIVPVTVDL